MDDPIFAAIERHRTAEAAFQARCNLEDDLAEDDIKLPRAENDHRTPEMVALVDEGIALREALAKTIPTTLAGLSAYLDYVATESNEQMLMFEEADECLDFVKAIAESARRLHRAA